MPITAIEGFVENGRIRLREDVVLPENARVVVVVDGFAGPGVSPRPISARVRSPRLAHPEQSADFRKQVVEVSADARL